MSFQLQRGQNVSLSRLAAMQRVAVGLGWDAQTRGGPDFNLDSSAFMLDANGRVPSDAHFIFFNNLTSPDGAVQHQGNNMTGRGTGDDEVVTVNLPYVAPNIQKIVFTITIYDAETRRQNFGMVNNAFIRLVNLADGEEVVRYNLNERFANETAMVFGELYRHQSDWKFRAVGQGFAGGLAAMANTFGVSTDDAPPAAAPIPVPYPQPSLYAQPQQQQPYPQQQQPYPQQQQPYPQQQQPYPQQQQPYPQQQQPYPQQQQPYPQQQPQQQQPYPFAPQQPTQYQQQQPYPFAPTPPTNYLPKTDNQIKVGMTGLRYQVLYPDAYSMLKVFLEAGQSIKAESDAMIAMSNSVDVEGKMDGGLFGGIGRMLAGENFFLQTLAARRGPGEVLLAQSSPGDIQSVELDGSRAYILQKDGFLAGTDSLQISAKVQNLMQGLFSGEGFFILRVSGRGTLFISSYGAIHPIDVPPGAEVVIDNNHLVAWPDGMQYKMEKASSGWISSFTSGEGLVCRFWGPGRVYIQSRNTAGFGSWVKQFLPAPAEAAASSANSAANSAANSTASGLSDAAQMLGNIGRMFGS